MGFIYIFFDTLMGYCLQKHLKIYQKNNPLGKKYLGYKYVLLIRNTPLGFIYMLVYLYVIHYQLIYTLKNIYNL